MALATTDLYNRAASNSSPSTTLAFSATAVGTSQDIVVGVAIAGTGQSVVGIADTAGNTYMLRIGVNGDGVRTEIWEAQATHAAGSNTITITFSGSVLASAVAVIYNAVTPQTVLGTPQDITSASGLSSLVGVGNAIQEVGNWVVGALGYAWKGGTTYQVVSGTLRGAAVPGVTGVALVFLDVVGKAYATNPMWVRTNTPVNWAAASLELRGGGATIGTPPEEHVDPTEPTVTWRYSYTVETPTYVGAQTATVECGFQGSGCGSAGGAAGNEML